MVTIKKVLIGDSWIGVELMRYYRFRDKEEKERIEGKIKEIISRYLGIDTSNKKIIFSKLEKGYIFYKVIE